MKVHAAVEAGDALVPGRSDQLTGESERRQPAARRIVGRGPRFSGVRRAAAESIAYVNALTEHGGRPAASLALERATERTTATFIGRG
jgi:hypothetical protein